MNQLSADQARTRFFVIQAVRLSGVAMILAGLLASTGRLDLPKMAGFVLLGLGMFETFIAPLLLARRWKSQEP